MTKCTKRSSKSSLTSQKRIKTLIRRDLLLSKYRPITVNIEVKLQGEGKNYTMVQLAV
jgi:hypothetical protein